MVIKFVILPEANCQPDKQSWADVSKLLKNKFETHFDNDVEFQHIEFMSDIWFDDTELSALADKVELKFPLILIDNELFSNGDKVNISKLIRSISERMVAK